MLKRFLYLFGLCVACGEDGRMPATPPVDLPAQWAALSERAGCSPIDDEEFDSDVMECASEYSVWLTCVAQDLAQCYCESDGELNCEGSYKPNEGPALCIPEIIDAEACRERAEATELNRRWQDLAGAAGCDVEDDAFWPAGTESSCAHFASDWLTCVASDASQCSCQAGVFHCDGSFDADLGAARCVSEYEWLESCQSSR